MPHPISEPRVVQRLVGICRSREYPPARLDAAWMNSWTGVGAVVKGMTAQGFDVELKQFPDGWRANFYPVGTAHSILEGSAERN